MSQKRKRLRIDSKQFIEVYMRTDFNWQVAEELNIPLASVAQKAGNLRSIGVKLPYRFSRDDAKELNEMIERIEAVLRSENE